MEGIFRVPGPQALIEELKEEFEKGESVALIYPLKRSNIFVRRGPSFVRTAEPRHSRRRKRPERVLPKIAKQSLSR